MRYKTVAIQRQNRLKKTALHCGFAFVVCLLFHLMASPAFAIAPRDTNCNMERPNIVLIMADDFGWMDLHCYGNQRLDTPNLDRLAKHGMRFTDGYAAASVCTPTRAAMMTGLSPARLAITNHAPGNGENFHLPNSNL